MSAIADPDDIPFPLLEKGDFVRLKEPYRPLPESLNSQTAEAMVAAAAKEDPEILERMQEGRPTSVFHLRDRTDVGHVTEFTHGTVVEIVSRYSKTAESNRPDISVVDEYDGTYCVRNVSLHLFNPENGLMYLGGHPTEPGKPEFVDHHVAEIILVHKHDQSWGNENEIDIAEKYGEWGIEDIGIPPESE